MGVLVSKWGTGVEESSAISYGTDLRSFGSASQGFRKAQQVERDKNDAKRDLT